MDGDEQSTAQDSREPAETVGDLGPLATALARWLCEKSEDGMCWPVREEMLIEAFPDAPTEALAEAIAELEADGFATSSHSIKGGLPRFRPTPELFIEFDPLFLNTDPLADAQQLIARILEGSDRISVPDFHEQTGWSARRFNPALSLVLNRIDERHVSQENDMRYPARFFFLTAYDRVELKRLAKELGG